MAQPIYFAPGYESPSKIKLEGDMLRAQIFERGIAQVTDAIGGYFDKKGEDRANKMSTMTALASTYGSKALGPHFADDYGKVLASYGIHLPQGDDGRYQIPESFEDHIRGTIMEHPEYIPAMLGMTKPAPSPEEVHWRDQEIQVKKDIAQLHAATERLAAGSRLEAANIMAGSRERAATTLAGSREKIAGMQVTGRQTVAEINAASKPYAVPSGYYNVSGKLVPAAKVDKDPSKYPSAYPLNQGQYDLQLKDKHLRLVNTQLAGKMALMDTKFQQDLASAEMKPFISVIGAAAKSKDPKVQRRLVSEMMTRFNDIEQLGMSPEEIEALVDNRTYLQHILDMFGNASILTPKDIKPGASPTQAETPKGPSPTIHKMDDGTDVYEEELVQ